MEPANSILIVEDEAIIAMDLSETLATHGYRISAVLPSGELALEHCSRQIPDLVLMDIHLQGRLDGLETARLLREQHGIPTVLLTAFYDDAMLQSARTAGVYAYLIKPYEERELCATMAMAIHRARDEQQLRQRLTRLEPAAADERAPLSPPRLLVQTLSTHLHLSLEDTLQTCERIPRVLRELFGLILAAPQCKVDRELLEAELWPESAPERARATFDSTILRLRKHLKEMLKIPNDKVYLSVRNSVVALEHASVDLHDFQGFDRQARELRKRQEDAAAAVCSEKACALWQGELLSGVNGFDRVTELRRHTTRQFVENCLSLARYYTTARRHDDAIGILSRALLVNPTEEDIVMQLVWLLRDCQMHGQAGQLLRDYEKHLIRDGLQRSEIQESLRKIEQRILFARHAP